MFSVMVCPSLKPKSSFGPESPTWPLLLISSSFFTHLQNEGDAQSHRHANKPDISAVNQNSTAHVKDSGFLFYIHHFTSLHFTSHHRLLKMVLQSHVEIKRVPPVPEADADESTATCGHDYSHCQERKCVDQERLNEKQWEKAEAS